MFTTHLLSLLSVPALGCLVLAGSLAAQTPGGFTTSGSGCPEPTTDTGPVLYGTLPAGTWHLAHTNLRFLSSGTDWSLEPGGSFLEPSDTATPMPGFDDQILGPFALGFAFPYPGGAGSTTSIEVNANGRIYLEAGTNPWSGGWNANMIRPDFLSATPSLCPLGVDLNLGSGGLLWFEERTVAAEQVAIVTFDDVPEYPDRGSNTFQCQLWESGEVVFSYRGINDTNSLQEALVGVSAGGGAPDPGASSLDVPLFLTLTGRPLIGETFRLGVGAVPATATSGVMSLAMAAHTTPVPITGAPAGCNLLIDQIYLDEQLTLFPPTGEVPVTWPYNPAAVGLSVECQAFVIDPAQGTAVPMLVSNRGTLTLGEPADLLFVAEGLNSYYGDPERGGFFRLESSPGASHPDIVGLEVSFAGTELYFDVEGNSGVGAQGFFDDGSGTGPGCRNAYYGSDVTCGLVYGGGLQPPSCKGTGTTGWVGGLPVGGSQTRFQELSFAFDDFTAGESFGFDCDTDGGGFDAGAQLLTVTVVFQDMSRVTQQILHVTDERAEGVLIP